MKTSTLTQVITLVIFVSILVLVIVFGDMKG